MGVLGLAVSPKHIIAALRLVTHILCHDILSALAQTVQDYLHLAVECGCKLVLDHDSLLDSQDGNKLLICLGAKVPLSHSGVQSGD